MVDRPIVQSFKLAKDSEGTKRKLLIFCMVLIFALVLTTFGISFIGWTDDIKSHLKRVLRAWELQISDFQVLQGNAATYVRCGG